MFEKRVSDLSKGYSCSRLVRISDSWKNQVVLGKLESLIVNL